MSKGIIAATMAAALCSSCQTYESYQRDVDANLDTRLRSYHGATVAEFQARTGMLAEDAYPTKSGRVFVFRTAPVYMTLPATAVTPAVTNAAQCQLLVGAKRISEGSTADDWQIIETRRSGACNNLRV